MKILMRMISLTLLFLTFSQAGFAQLDLPDASSSPLVDQSNVKAASGLDPNLRNYINSNGTEAAVLAKGIFPDCPTCQANLIQKLRLHDNSNQAGNAKLQANPAPVNGGQ